MSRVVTGLSGVFTDLQEISRGIHPAILSKGGLGAAIKTLARRSRRVLRRRGGTDHVAKHANASAVTICASADDELRLAISDDGVGGAGARGGSGLIGLKDRVEAIAGRLQVDSPAGNGTRLVATIPLRAQ